MTEKQEKILQAALELFAREGYKMTSTSKVAKLAGVSEGLIFRHFRNKDGLLKAILKEGEDRIKVIFSNIIFEPDPKRLIKKTLEAFSPEKIGKDQMEFWKLQYKIKWELEQYGEHKMEPLHLALVSAFRKLGYNNPELEAIHLQVTLDGLATRYFLMKEFNFIPVLEFLIDKYNL